MKRTEGDNQLKKAEKRVHTYVPAPGAWYFARYLVLLKRKHSTARHNTAPQGKRHGTTRRCAALLSYI